MAIHHLLLRKLAVGDRVRADGDVIYVTDGVEVPDRTRGTIVRPLMTGLSVVRWDGPGFELATSHDSLELEDA